MQILAFIFAIMLFLAAPARADEHALGFALGATTGAGFSYRYMTDAGYGLQATGLTYRSRSWNMTIYGLQGLLQLQRSDWGRFYLVAGASSWSNSWIYGAGPGIQLGSGKGASLAIELPLTVFVFQNGGVQNGGVPIPIPNVSLMYAF